jgi:ElaB/YqjD/DUF883 family membrane-anchored ribosome-binding protein
MQNKDVNTENLDQLSEIEKRLEEIKIRTTEFVQKNPLTAVALALGIGYVIAKLLSGKRS